MLINNVKQLDDFCETVHKTKVLFVDTETTGLKWTDRLLGISLGTKVGEDFIGGYVEWDSLSATPILELISNPEITKVLHNAKFDIKILMRNGFTFAGQIFDTMIAYWFLNPRYKGGDLKGLMLELFNIDSPDYKELLKLGGQVFTKTQKNGKVRTKVLPAKDLTEVAIDIVAKYATNDVLYTSMLYDYCMKELENNPTKELLYKVDLKMIPVLVNMEMAGVKINSASMERQSIVMAEKIVELKAQLDAIVGRPMNYKSPAQVGNYLFQELKLKPKAYSKKTQQPTVDEYTLKKYSEEGNEFCKVLREYKQLCHMKVTYLDGLVLKADEDGRLHGNYGLTGTGRLSCSQPNLQNIPAEGEIGDAIRDCFIAEEGFDLVRADFSQMEIRMLAHVAQDRRMIYALRSGGDFHTKTAEYMFKGKVIEKGSPERSAAKTVNFGIAYGLSATSLARDLEITFDEADAFIKAHQKAYPSANKWKWRLREEVQRTKSVTTIFGRKRDLSQSKGNISNQALNTPIQGACSDVVKVAMIRLAEALKGTRSRIIVQVHDELVVECPKEDTLMIMQLMKEIMESANTIFFQTIPSFMMTCPFLVEVNSGKSWKEAH